MAEPEPRFDELIHPSTRLSIVALLASADWIDFAFVRDRLGLSDSALSKQFATLEGAGYITIERRVTAHRRRVRVRLTSTGRTAFKSHVAALQSIVATATPPTPDSITPSPSGSPPVPIARTPSTD
jgi:DNA-binding transcriptional ArsR family regulator